MRCISSFLTLWLVSGNWVEKNKKALQKKRWVLLLNPSPWHGSLRSEERCWRYTSESSSFTGQPFAPHLYVLCSNSAFFRIRTRPCPLCLESGQQARVTSVAFEILKNVSLREKQSLQLGFFKEATEFNRIVGDECFQAFLNILVYSKLSRIKNK